MPQFIKKYMLLIPLQFIPLDKHYLMVYLYIAAKYISISLCLEQYMANVSKSIKSYSLEIKCSSFKMVPCPENALLVTTYQRSRKWIRKGSLRDHYSWLLSAPQHSPCLDRLVFNRPWFPAKKRWMGKICFHINSSSW